MGLRRDLAGLTSAAGLEPTDVEASALWATAADPKFPGALLPARRDGGLVIYAVAETPAEWRRLRPLLTAFAGPTLTDFAGASSLLDRSDAFEREIMAVPPHAAARIRPGPAASVEAWTLASLRRLQTRLAEAPDLTIARPEPTSRLLARLRDALNVTDYAEAWAIHEVLSCELRLDAVNLLQTEMLILSESGRWSDVRGHGRFEIMCHGEPAPAIAAVLLGALARVDLAGLEGGDDSTALVVWSSIAHLARPLLRIARTEDPHVARLRALADGNTATPSAGDDVASSPAEAADPLRQANASLMALETAPVGREAQALEGAQRAIAALDEEARRTLLQRPRVRALRSEAEVRSGGVPEPRGWLDWIAYLGDPAFPALEHVARACETWTLPDAGVDPADAQVLASAILDIPEGLAGERFCESLPYLATWAQEDPRWPRSAYVRVYVAALTRTALGARRGEPAARSACLLLEGALSCGLEASEYRDSLEAAREIARVGFGLHSVYAALDLLDVACRFEPADGDALAAFAFATLGDVSALHGRLTPGQRLVASALGRRFGWKAPGDPEARDDGGDALPSLRPMTIGVYTLTESAGRQAKDFLEAAAPGVEVLLNHDHVGTAPLAAIARNVDLFVVVAASAKHAATDFIRDRRGGRPLIYAAGRGAASVIRAVEQWMADGKS